MFRIPNFLAVTAALAAAASAASAQEFVFATGSQGGSWYPIGGGIKSIVEKQMPGVTITVTPGAGMANIVGVESGRFPIGFANAISTVDAMKGREPFRAPSENVCNLGSLYPQYLQIIAVDSAGVKSVKDFADKSLTTQQHGHTGEMLTRQLLEANDMSYENLDDVSHVSYQDSVSLMKDGNAQIFTLGTSLPSGAVMDLAASQEIDMVPVSEEVIARFKEQNPAFVARTIPAGAYPGVDEDVPAITYDTHLIAACDFSPEIVTAVLTAIADNNAQLSSATSAMKGLTVKDMATDIGVPWHPAAKKFYEERGAL